MPERPRQSSLRCPSPGARSASSPRGFPPEMATRSRRASQPRLPRRSISSLRAWRPLRAEFLGAGPRVRFAVASEQALHLASETSGGTRASPCEMARPPAGVAVRTTRQKERSMSRVRPAVGRGVAVFMLTLGCAFLWSSSPPPSTSSRSVSRSRRPIAPAACSPLRSASASRPPTATVSSSSSWHDGRFLGWDSRYESMSIMRLRSSGPRTFKSPMPTTRRTTRPMTPLCRR